MKDYSRANPSINDFERAARAALQLFGLGRDA